MRQLTTRVEDHIADAFYQFCKRQEIKPYDLLGSIIDFYGRAEILTRRHEKRELTQDQALVELGRLVSDMKKLAKANGEFKKAIGDMLEPYGVKIEQLGLL